MQKAGKAELCLLRTLDLGPGKALQKLFLEPVPKLLLPLCLLGPVCRGLFERTGKADSSCHILCAGTDAALLATTLEQRLYCDAVLGPEKADLLWPVDLRGREREHVHMERCHIDSKGIDSLRGIRMEPERHLFPCCKP